MHNRPFRKCALPQCAGLRFNLVHKFPRRKERLETWLDALCSPRLNTIPHERLNLLWICCRHFRVEDYVNPQSKTLNGAAVPSLNLKNLDDLDKCRQGDVEKATVLTDEEIIWIQESKCKGQLELLKSRTATANPSQGLTIPENTSSIPSQPCCHHSVPSNLVTTEGPANAASFSSVVEDSSDFTLFLEDGYIEINDYKLRRNYELNSLWLRSLCRCSKCFDVENSTPKMNVFDLPTDVQPIMANYVVADETTKLEIVWDDGHTSTYDLNKIYEKTQVHKLPNPARNHLLWSACNTKTGDDFKPLLCYDILMDNNIIPTALKRLQKAGILVITALPRSDTDSVLKRTLISKLFNHVWDNLITEKRSQFCATHNTPFTNCTFESMDKGLQMLTVPYHKENIKIKLCLVDGFYAASQLKQLHKVSYDFLTQYVMEYSFTDKQGYCHKTKQPTIDIKDNCERITFSPYHLEDVKAQDFVMIAKHSKNFNDLLKAPENQWHIDLNSEMLVILDNFRICWCITEHQTENELDCFYMERRHYVSSLHKLKQTFLLNIADFEFGNDSVTQFSKRQQPRFARNGFHITEITSRRDEPGPSGSTGKPEQGSDQISPEPSGTNKSGKPKSILEEHGILMGKVIGTGNYAKVKIGYSEEYGKQVAIKIISKVKAAPEYTQKFLPREIEAVKGLHHENLITFYQSIETSHRVYLIMQLAENGTLLDYVREKRYLEESQARNLFKQLISAVEYIHSKGVVHRDIKCENLLLDENYNIKLIDFGFARKDTRTSDQQVILSKTFCGSYAYASPEILRGVAYDPFLSDIWACGVVCYAMVFGRLPYDGSNVHVLLKRINTSLVFPKTPTASNEVKHLIMQILAPVKIRFRFQQIKEDPWMTIS